MTCKVVNGDFETGDLSGWFACMNFSCPTGTCTVMEEEGNHFCRLEC